MKNKFFFLVIISFSFCFFIFYKGLQIPSIYSPELTKEKNFPEIIGKDFFSGQQISTDTIFKKENFYLINIWASWCIPCREEHSYLIKLKKTNIEMIGINYKDNKNNAKEFLDELGNPYNKILDDKNGVLSIKLGAYGVPETFLVNKEKLIIKKIIGPINDKNFNDILKLVK